MLTLHKSSDSLWRQRGIGHKALLPPGSLCVKSSQVKGGIGIHCLLRRTGTTLSFSLCTNGPAKNVRMDPATTKANSSQRCTSKKILAKRYEKKTVVTGDKYVTCCTIRSRSSVADHALCFLILTTAVSQTLGAIPTKPFS
jgi:hypothetical protein